MRKLFLSFGYEQFNAHRFHGLTLGDLLKQLGWEFAEDDEEVNGHLMELELFELLDRNGLYKYRACTGFKGVLVKDMVDEEDYENYDPDKDIRAAVESHVA